VEFYAGVSLRVNTKRTYSTHHRSFFGICSSLNIDPNLAISEKHLCAVIIIFCHGNHKITTLPGFVSAIQNLVLSLGHPVLPRNRLYSQVCAGLNNWFGDSNVASPKQGFTLSDLCEFRANLSLSTFVDARNWCACLFAFFGLLRIKEYSCGSLRVKDVCRQPWGIELIIPYSKTSFIPAFVDIIRRDDQLCPLAAYLSYTSLIPQSLRRPDYPFFLHSTRSASPMSDTEFLHYVRDLITTVLHCDASNYAGHSFRRGGTSALLQAGVPESTIASHGRWKSLAYRGYFDVQHSLTLRLSATAHLRLLSLP
jgi:hypothetical protein